MTRPRRLRCTSSKLWRPSTSWRPRRGRITAAQQADFLERLRLLPVMIEHRPAVWLGQRILPLARAYRLSAYDAAYLDLAIRDSLPLATLDGDLRTAALAAGVPLLTGEV